MNHKTKTQIFKFLDVLPSRLGYKIYHLLQNFSENKNLDFSIKSTESTYETFASICRELKIEVKDKSVIEIGSGWLPITPYFLKYLSKVKNIFTFDLNEHYQKKSLLELNNRFSKIYDINIQPKKGSKYNLPEGIKYFPLQNIINAEIPSAEIVFSRFVLEHVTPEDIFAMHKKFKDSFKKDTYIIHFISPSDHRAYSDSSLSIQDFLKYSKREWNTIQTKFDYHNRLRLPQYVEIFENLGYEIVYLTSDSVKEGSSQHNLFKKLNIHEDYKKYSEQELTAGSINIVLKI